MSKAKDNNKTSPPAYSETEEEIASRLFGWLTEFYGSDQLGFLGAANVVTKTIEAIRGETKE